MNSVFISGVFFEPQVNGSFLVLAIPHRSGRSNRTAPAVTKSSRARASPLPRSDRLCLPEPGRLNLQSRLGRRRENPRSISDKWEIDKRPGVELVRQAAFIYARARPAGGSGERDEAGPAMATRVNLTRRLTGDDDAWI